MGDIRTISTEIKNRAHELGFDLVGITGPEPPAHFDVFQKWIDSGYHAGMQYLAGERALTRRADPRRILPGCRSIIITGTYYDPPSRESQETRIAAYALGEDYHDVLKEGIRALAEYIEAELGRPFEHRIYVDTGPLLERELAMRAGLGWIGKNTCLIHPRRGSYLLLAEMLLEVDLTPDPPFSRDFCGSCTRCIDACPTKCILPERTIDAGRCISYLTIEEKGALPEPMRGEIGDWLFGCDICQEVCPWNLRFAHPGSNPAFKPREILNPPQLAGFLELESESWHRGLRGSPLERPRRRGLVRNAAVVAGNTGRSDLLGQLEWIMLKDAEPLLREQAAWAIAGIAGSAGRPPLEAALQFERDEAVRKAIQRFIEDLP
jgi:epoxyqueuosine reductase